MSKKQDKPAPVTPDVDPDLARLEGGAGTISREEIEASGLDDPDTTPPESLEPSNVGVEPIPRPNTGPDIEPRGPLSTQPDVMPRVRVSNDPRVVRQHEGPEPIPGFELPEDAATSNDPQERHGARVLQTVREGQRLGEQLRPSDLREVIKEVTGRDMQPVAAPEPQTFVDPHRFLRDNGLSAPRKRYRVTAVNGSMRMKEFTCDAVDPSDAINQAVTERRLSNVHHWHFTTILLAE